MSLFGCSLRDDSYWPDRAVAVLVVLGSRAPCSARPGFMRFMVLKRFLGSGSRVLIRFPLSAPNRRQYCTSRKHRTVFQAMPTKLDAIEPTLSMSLCPVPFTHFGTANPIPVTFGGARGGTILEFSNHGNLKRMRFATFSRSASRPLLLLVSKL